MFHIILGDGIKTADSLAVCGLKSFRAGVNEQKFAKFLENGSLNEGRACKRCRQMVGRVRQKPNRKKGNKNGNSRKRN